MATAVDNKPVIWVLRPSTPYHCSCTRISISLIIFTPLLGRRTTTATSHRHSPNFKYGMIRITCQWLGGIITANILMIPLLGRHTTTTSHSLKWIRITWRIVKIQTSDSFFEGFFVIEGQSHWDPHQNYCWCNTLGRQVNVISKTKDEQIL